GLPGAISKASGTIGEKEKYGLFGWIRIGWGERELSGGSRTATPHGLGVSPVSPQRATPRGRVGFAFERSFPSLVTEVLSPLRGGSGGLLPLTVGSNQSRLPRRPMPP